jgi:hypothetical protein
MAAVRPQVVIAVSSDPPGTPRRFNSINAVKCWAFEAKFNGELIIQSDGANLVALMKGGVVIGYRPFGQGDFEMISSKEKRK